MCVTVCTGHGFTRFINNTTAFTTASQLSNNESPPLAGFKVAMLAENMYEDLELWYPLLRLKEAGAKVEVVGSGSSPVFKSKRG